MKFPSLTAVLLVFGTFSLTAQDEPKAGATNVPTDPFKDLKPEPEAAEYAMEVDRTRGNLFISAKDGKYIPGSHFANWQWTLDAKRWGRYYAVLRYTSMEPKMGIQLKVGDSMVKSYAPRSGGHKDHQVHELVMGFVYIPKPGEYPVNLLTGDKSNGPNFYVKGVRFMPAPEAEMDSVGQGIDGTITLDAKTAATYAEMMRYEPKEEKNCLGYWVDEKDWAEWVFEVSSPGTFKVEIFQGCGKGQGGSEVALLINGQTKKFKVEDTGGFQNWKALDLGTVDIKTTGTNRIAVKPLSKAAKAVMDVQKVVLTPVEG